MHFAPNQQSQTSNQQFGANQQSCHSMVTGSPVVTMVENFNASQFASRMQPWLAARPMVSGLLVPWMPIPILSSPHQRDCPKVALHPRGAGQWEKKLGSRF